MKGKLVFLILVCALLMPACYINEEAAPNQMAVMLDEGRIYAIVGPGGVYSDGGWFSDIKFVDINTKTFSVEDPEILTSDNQAIALKITIQARRKSDEESITNLITNWSSIVNDENMVGVISATAREGMKNGVRGFTLPQLLNDRNGLADKIREQLEADAAKYSVEIINVTIENVSVDENYMQTLSETAQFKAEIDKEKQRQELIKQQTQTSILASEQEVLAAQAQLLAEQAKTDVQVEIAKRQGEITAASYQVYLDNPAAYRLEELARLKDIFGDKAVFFVPSDSNIILNPGQIVPIQ